jgi:hypothetical protein
MGHFTVHPVQRPRPFVTEVPPSSATCLREIELKAVALSLIGRWRLRSYGAFDRCAYFSMY